VPLTRTGWQEWCLNGFAVDFHYDSRGAQTGLMIMNYELIGYGRDDGTRNIVVFGRPTSVIFSGIYTPQSTVALDLGCTGEADMLMGCVGGGTHRLTMAEWLERSISGSWVGWEIDSHEESAPESFEKVLYHAFDLEVGFYDRVSVETTDFGFRCDSAPYITGRPKACLFSDVIPHLQYAIKDSAGNYTNQREVAEHIRQAQDDPDNTDPRKEGGGKRIPGKYIGTWNEGYLTRVPGKDSEYPSNGDYLRNEGYVTVACAAIHPPEDMVDPECDEYPFRSTYQGAANADWDFSIRYVSGSQNSSAGAVLGTYYREDRILYYDDAFYVKVVDQAGAPAVGAPIVRTIPEVQGLEGEPIQLHATASGGTAQWSYRPDGYIDPGTSCTFSDPSSLTPTITCNDSGTFIATVTVNDGVSPAVSADTKVVVTNDPPRVSFTTPTPWQVFRVGEPIVFDAPITDSGSNDVHRCQYGWDDGEAWDDQFGANSRNCGVVHSYDHAGMYNVDLVVTDDDFAQGTASVMIVVYDTNEGTASIAGTTATPAGALVDAPSASGDTSLHYTAQYPSGNNVPEAEVKGQSLAWVDGTDFRLELDAMQWLVITEDGKIAGRGTGLVDGKPGYTWVIYGWDYCDGSNSPGCQNIPSDRTRLVVFETATGKIAYDHSPGSTEFDVDRISPTVMTSGAVQVRRWPR
jgi:hypothetical protein